MERVPYDLWRNHILCLDAPLPFDYFEPNAQALAALCSVRGLVGACKWGRALVARILAPRNDVVELFSGHVFWEVAKERQHGLTTRATVLKRIYELVRNVPQPLLVHMWLWRMWYNNHAAMARIAHSQALALSSHHADGIWNAAGRLAKRERQLREGVYGVHRPSRLRGADDKEWTESMRDKDALELARLKAEPRDHLDNAVAVAEAACRALLNEPRAWLALDGPVGRMHVMREWEEELKELRKKDEEACAQIAQLERKRAHITTLATEVEQKIARVKRGK